jgi:hypothetical protein
MPQFELDHVGRDGLSGLFRGRGPEEAVRRATGITEDAPIRVEDEPDLQGWREVYIDGQPAGRVRLHQRMRFRRD